MKLIKTLEEVGRLLRENPLKFYMEDYMDFYCYKTLRKNVFLEENQALFLAIRDRVAHLIGQAGAVKMSRAMSVGISHDSWTAMACVDRLVELGEIRELNDPGRAGQDRVFVKVEK